MMFYFQIQFWFVCSHLFWATRDFFYSIFSVDWRRKFTACSSNAKKMYEHNIECNTLCWILMHKEFCMFALRQSLDNFQLQPKNLLYYIIIIFQFSHFVYFASCAVFCLTQYFKLDYQMNEIRWKCFLRSIQISRKFCHLPSKISNENINNASDGKWKYLLWRCDYESRRVVLFASEKKSSNSWESCVCSTVCWRKERCKNHELISVCISLSWFPHEAILTICNMHHSRYSTRLHLKW